MGGARAPRPPPGYATVHKGASQAYRLYAQNLLKNKPWLDKPTVTISLKPDKHIL